MTTTPEQIAVTHQTALDTALAAVKTAFNYNASLMALNVNTAHTMFDDGTVLMRTLAEARSSDDTRVACLEHFRRLWKMSLSYSRSAFNIVVHGTEETIRPWEIQLSTAQRIVARKIEKAAESAPVGSEVMVAAVKSGINAANRAYARVSKATRQVADLTETNMSTAAEAAEKVVSNTARVAKKQKIA